MWRQAWARGRERLPGLRQRRRTEPPPTAGHPVAMHDVTAFAGEIDLDPLGAIQGAPAWMTRAERLLLYTLAFCLRPSRYLEIGTYRGGSALLVASALDSLGSDGRLFCVDRRPEIVPEHWQLLQARTTLVEGDSPGVLPEVKALAGGGFDLVLVDGDHTYAGVLADAEGVLPCMQAGGHVLFHDGFNPDVGRAIDAFVEAHAGEVLDLGLLTREVTVHVDAAGRRVTWGGLRLVQVL